MANNHPGVSQHPTLFGERDPVFRPWPLPPKQPPNIAEFVARLKAQGIEFRELSDEGLRKQIEEEKKEELKNGGAKDESSKAAKAAKAAGASSSSTTIDLLERPRGREAMMARRDEVIVSLMNAVQSGAICLDLVSLLLSKDRPTQALQTLSNVRDKVGIGTLSAGRIANAAQAARALQIRSHGRAGGHGGGAITGADVLQNLDETTRTNAERLLEHKTECVGWQLLAMDRASDMLQAAQRRLHTQMRREQRYWSEMLAVQERGWCLSRVPGQRRVLRVKFGFSEAAPDLRPLGFAPMHRSKGRHVALDLSFLGPPTAVVLTLRRRTDSSGCSRNRRIEVGRSRVPTRLPASAALEDRILEARNTIFAKELWRELGRETRLLVAHDVVWRDNTIVFAAGPHTEGVLSLETLRLKKKKKPAKDGTDGTDGNETHNPQLDNTAEAMCTALHLLLSHGHREHYNRRSQPGPPVDSTTALPTYCMLRAIVSNLKYEMALKHLALCLGNVCGLLHGVGHTGSRFALYERPITAPVPGMPVASGGSSASERLCTAFLTQREFSFEYTISPHTRLLIRSRTYIALIKVQYLVQLLPPAPGSSGSGGVTVNPLLDSFPPADAYSTLQDVAAYVHDATAHVLARRALELARAWEASSAGKGALWTLSADGQSIRQTRSAFATLRFEIAAAADDKTSDGRSSSDTAVGDDDDDVDADDDDDDMYTNDDYYNADGLPPVPVDSPLEAPPVAELRVDASWPHDDNGEAAVCETWTWSAAGLQAQPGSVDLEAMMEGCVSGALRPDKAG